MKRTLGLVALAVLLLTLLAPTTAGASEDGPRLRPPSSELEAETARASNDVAAPRRREIAELFPKLDDRRIDTSTTPIIGIYLTAKRDCVGTKRVASARAGVQRDFYQPGNDLAERRVDNPSPKSYRFAGKRAAAKAMRKIAAYIERCTGRVKLESPDTGERYVTRLMPIETVDVADGTVGYHYKKKVRSYPTERRTHLVTRSGRYLLLSDVSHPKRYPDVDAVTDLARLQVEAVS